MIRHTFNINIKDAGLKRTGQQVITRFPPSDAYVNTKAKLFATPMVKAIGVINFKNPGVA